MISLQCTLIASVSEDAIFRKETSLASRAPCRDRTIRRGSFVDEKVTQISARTTRRIPGDMKERGRKSVSRRLAKPKPWLWSNAVSFCKPWASYLQKRDWVRTLTTPASAAVVPQLSYFI